MRLKTLLLTCAAASILVIGACTTVETDDEDTDTDSEPTTEAVEDDQEDAADDESDADSDSVNGDATPEDGDDSANGEESEDANGDATPAAVDEDAVRLEPFPITLNSEDGEQEGKLGAYLWFHESGVGAETESGGFAIHEEPLALTNGEEITFETPVSLFPESVEIAFYEYEANIQEDISTREGRMDGFVMQEAAIVIEDLEDVGDSASWTVDMEPGEYFIRIYTVWEDPEFPLPESGTPITLERPRSAEYAFRVIVE